MKLVIEQDGIKRALEGPFEVCLSKQDAQAIIRCLREAADSQAFYGWVLIHDCNVKRCSDTAPIPWSAT